MKLLKNLEMKNTMKTRLWIDLLLKQNLMNRYIEENR
jgi:hypothetical protein